MPCRRPFVSFSPVLKLSDSSRISYIKEILDGTVWVVEGSTHGSLDHRPLEAHRLHALNGLLALCSHSETAIATCSRRISRSNGRRGSRSGGRGRGAVGWRCGRGRRSCRGLGGRCGGNCRFGRLGSWCWGSLGLLSSDLVS